MNEEIEKIKLDWKKKIPFREKIIEKEPMGQYRWVKLKSKWESKILYLKKFLG